jgi:predicted  nucleic acid-binding Zn-ribbon protein
VRVLANGSSPSESITVQGQQVRSLRLRSEGTVVMGLIWKAASILMLGGLTNHGGRESPAKAARAQAKAARAQAGLAEAETTVAGEQAAAIARALQEDEAHAQADLEQVAEKEAEAVPWARPADS